MGQVDREVDREADDYNGGNGLGHAQAPAHIELAQAQDAAHHASDGEDCLSRSTMS